MTARPLSEMVYEKLREAICDGRFRPGEHLIQADLAQRLGVSRIPVREALHRLSEEGLVEAKPRRGMLVRRPEPGELEEAWAAARVLVQAAMEHAVRRVKDAEVAELERLHQAMMKRLETGRPGELAALNKRFHRGIFEAGGLGKLFDCMDALTSCYPQGTQMSVAMRGPTAVGEHAEILDALRRRDRPALLAAADKHTTNNARAILRVVSAGCPSNDSVSS